MEEIVPLNPYLGYSMNRMSTLIFSFSILAPRYWTVYCCLHEVILTQLIGFKFWVSFFLVRAIFTYLNQTLVQVLCKLKTTWSCFVQEWAFSVTNVVISLRLTLQTSVHDSKIEHAFFSIFNLTVTSRKCIPSFVTLTECRLEKNASAGPLVCSTAGWNVSLKSWDQNKWKPKCEFIWRSKRFRFQLYFHMNLPYREIPLVNAVWMSDPVSNEK